MFVTTSSGERLHVLKRDMGGVWVISYDQPALPVFISQEAFDGMSRIETPEEYIRNCQSERTSAAEKRLQLIQPALRDARCITNSDFRKLTFKNIAEVNGTTVNRVSRIFCRYLARGEVLSKKPREHQKRPEFDDAICRYYFSAKRHSLRTTYELMLLENYENQGILDSVEVPTWASFRHYYERCWSKSSRKLIAREGLSHYQRNERSLYGSAMAYRDKVGSYQIDETLGDVFLVSKYDRSKVVGRPYLYLAVDTCTQLITGLYVGLESGENALMSCIANAASDKVAYCASLGINIEPEEWPCSGMPMELITDRGREFLGERISELCVRYGVEINSAPPFRAEEKPLVERCIGLLQHSYESMLRGKGGIGEDANERWAVDYRKQAVLTLEEYTKIVVYCIRILNCGRILKKLSHLPPEAPKTANKLWAWFCEQGNRAIMDVDEQEVYARSLPRMMVKVSRTGMLVNHMRYLPPRGKVLTAGEKVVVAYDARCVDRIYLLGEEKQLIPCELAPSDERYRGYSLKDSEIIRAQDREQKKKLERDVLNSQVGMRKEVMNIIRQAEMNSNGSTEITDIKIDREREKERLS